MGNNRENGNFQVKIKFVWEKLVQKLQKYQ